MAKVVNPIKDFNSYEGLLDVIRKNGSSINAFENQDGELVSLYYCVSSDGMKYIKKRVFQNNGCTRIQNYYEDGSSEEMYERGD